MSGINRKTAIGASGYDSLESVEVSTIACVYRIGPGLTMKATTYHNYSAYIAFLMHRRIHFQWMDSQLDFFHVPYIEGIPNWFQLNLSRRKVRIFRVNKETQNDNRSLTITKGKEFPNSDKTSLSNVNWINKLLYLLLVKTIGIEELLEKEGEKPSVLS